jgi:hypothetical protein
MKKIGILTDSSSGLSIKQCEDIGIHSLPMPFLIKEKEYYEEKNISKKEFFKVLNEGASFSTSQPSRDEVLDKWDDVDHSYYKVLVDEAVETISQYGDFEWFVSDEPVAKPVNMNFMNLPEEVGDEVVELPFD